MPEQIYTLSAETAKLIAEFVRLWPQVKSLIADRPATSGGLRGLLSRLPGRDREWRGKITANHAQGGTYYAKTIYGPAKEPASTLAESDLGTIASTADTIFLNLEEVGSATHVLTEESATPYALGFVIGATNEYRVVAGFSILSTTCEDPGLDDGDDL